jgi:hypothetical protein
MAFVKLGRSLRQRLATQRLASAPLPTAAAAVRLLTCVQSQERDHAFFSLGLRSKRTTYAAVQAEYDGQAFLRTHILRPTWHFVAPEDLRWILALTSRRVVSSLAARHRQLGLDDTRLVSRAQDALVELLRGRHYLTRRELGDAFAQARGMPRAGEQLGHLLLVAELDGLICSGPMKGVHHTYALVDEIVPPAPALDRDEAHARLAHRFFAGHGPATIRDFTRWSSLTIAGTKDAVAELGPALEQVEIDGEAHWFDPATVARRSRSAPPAYLFPVYDEVMLTYPAHTFPWADGHPYAESPDPFWAWVVAGERNIGVWKRTVKRDRVAVEVRLAPSIRRDERMAVEVAACRLADFLERELEYVDDGGIRGVGGSRRP